MKLILVEWFIVLLLQILISGTLIVTGQETNPVPRADGDLNETTTIMNDVSPAAALENVEISKPTTSELDEPLLDQLSTEDDKNSLRIADKADSQPLVPDDADARNTLSAEVTGGGAENLEVPVNISATVNETNVNETWVNETKPLRTIAHCAVPESPSSIVTGDEVLSLDKEILQTELNEGEPNSGTMSPEVTDSLEDLNGMVSDSESRLHEKQSSLRLVNMSELVQDILWSNASIKSRVIPANCSIVLFYASWCPFSAKAAPHFNALPRAFPSLRVAAIDVSVQNSVNSYFGILSVPTVILYHNGKSIAKFNESSFTLHQFAEFVHTHTDLRSDENINVTSRDFTGPLPSVTTKRVDIYLIFAWIFIVICFAYYVTKSALWRRAIDLVRTTWREAEDHVHQD